MKSNKPRRAVIVGKFHPPHKGHHHLINTALEECDEVYVLPCDNPNYTIPAEIRANWLRLAHPKAIVKPIPELPPELDDSPHWSEHTIKFLGFRPDVCYTSENYGITWAQEMGCKHRMVDFGRTKIPISATKVRDDVATNWGFMLPRIRQAFCRRIVVLGAESTGTTTLAEGLAKHYSSPWTVELGRYYTMSLASAKHDWQDEDFANIARLQQQYEDDLAGLSSGMLICDTNAFATKIWQTRYMGESTAEVDRIAKTAPADLYILTGDEIPFVQDGFRDGEHIRHWMHQAFVSALSDLKTPYIIVTGSHKKRLQQAIKAIDALPRKRIKLYA